jgi:hypothetical protein
MWPFSETNAAAMRTLKTQPMSNRQDFRNRVDRHIANPRDRPHRTALTQHPEDLDALLYGQFVHARSI